MRHTSASLGQLCQPQQGVVAGNGLKCDIRMPLAFARLTTVTTAPGTGETIGIELLGLLG